MIDLSPTRLAILSIEAYQRRLSPRKGFRCAHRVLHGGDSCSQHIKRAIADLGLKKGLAAARIRFAACREASRTLRTSRRAARSHARLTNHYNGGGPWYGGQPSGGQTPPGGGPPSGQNPRGQPPKPGIFGPGGCLQDFDQWAPTCCCLGLDFGWCDLSALAPPCSCLLP